MFVSNSYRYELNDFLAYPNLVFKLTFYQPFRRNNEPRQSILAWVCFWVGAIVMVYQNPGIVIAFFLNKRQDIDILRQVAEDGAILGLLTVAICKMTLLYWYRHDIGSLFDELDAYFPGRRRIHQCCRGTRYKVDQYAEFSKKLMKYTTIFFIFAFLVYNIIPIGHSLVEYLIVGGPFKRRYQSNTWYPWNGDSVFSYALNYFFQMYASVVGVSFIMGGEFTLCFFLTQMRMHFEFLANTLEELDAVQSEAHPDCLKWLIEYHNTLIRMSTQINHIFDISFFVNFATSSVSICLMGCSMVMGINLVDAIRYSIGLLSLLLFNLFICYNGSEFTQASAMLHSAAFYHNWYDASPAYRKNILIIIMRAAKPSVLQAYKFTTVSMGTFMTIVKFSYQLFTFIQAMEG